jgi:glycosyltransferase involved in cell wall biosynthesis
MHTLYGAYPLYHDYLVRSLSQSKSLKGMNQLILDCDLMRFRNTGLYYYCLNLGHYVNRLFENEGSEPMNFYIPPREISSFDDSKRCIVEKPLHKYFKPFLWGCRVWHAPFQSGRILPYKNKDVNVLLTIHDLNALHEDLPFGEREKSLAHTQKLIDRADAIVCISEFCKSDVLSNCDVGNKPVYVIHNGTHVVVEPALTKDSYKPRRPFLFAMGDVNRKKNFHTLTSLVEQTDLELVIAGRLAESDYVAAINKDAEQKKISDRVHVLGPVSEGEKAWYLKNCKAFVHPSLAEGFGATVVEAMSFGKPLFLSNLTSLPEVGGDVAFYFKSFQPQHMRQVFYDGMKEYFKNGLAERIEERGKQFDWIQKAGEYLNVYKTLL